jgi:ribonuclease HII
MTAAAERGWVPAEPDLSLEQAYWRMGMAAVGGIDEAGRGAWAGPVAAGVVVLPPDPTLSTALHGVRDSKEMTPVQRAAWSGQIKSAAAAWGVGMASHQEIDALGIVPATRLAARRALEMLPCFPDILLIDWLYLPEVQLPQTALVKGDGRVLSIACASVLAKTSRDALLVDLDALYPDYGFAAHKGYGTAAHLAALRLHGPCPIHRLSFKPLMGHSG